MGLLPSLFILAAYCKILQTACYHELRIAAAINSVLHNQTDAKLNMMRETRAAKMVGTVLGAFIVTWGPLFLIMIVDIALHNSINSYIYAGGVIFATLNSALNPIIYASMNSGFRETFKALLQCRLNNRVAPDIA